MDCSRTTAPRTACTCFVNIYVSSALVQASSLLHARARGLVHMHGGPTHACWSVLLYEARGNRRSLAAALHSAVFRGSRVSGCGVSGFIRAQGFSVECLGSKGLGV